MRGLNFLNVECRQSHRAEVSDETLAAHLGNLPTLANCLGLVPKFKCIKCGSKAQRIFDDSDRLIFDADQVTLCQACETPIPLPRIQALPQTLMCVACAEAQANPPPEPPHPLPPPDKRTCPRCKSDTVVNQNSQDGCWFVGCSAFPKCRFTTEL